MMEASLMHPQKPFPERKPFHLMTKEERLKERLKYECRRVRSKIWDMSKKRERFEANRWVEGHVGESFATASVEELTKLKGYLEYKLVHGHCPIHENDHSKLRYKRDGGSTQARTKIKEKLIAAFGEKCAKCGKTGIPLTLDHIHPIALGGKNEFKNSQLLCVPCHVKKTRTDSKLATAKYFAEKFPEKVAKGGLVARKVSRAPKSPKQ